MSPVLSRYVHIRTDSMKRLTSGYIDYVRTCHSFTLRAFIAPLQFDAPPRASFRLPGCYAAGHFRCCCVMMARHARLRFVTAHAFRHTLRQPADYADY